MHIETKIARTFMGRFETNDDLLDAVNRFITEKQINLGTINIIGAVKKASLGYYSQEQKKYTDCVKLDKKLEIASAMGNISLKDNKPFAHIHIVFADFDGKAFGGHLMPGTIVYAAEFFIQEYSGKTLNRVLDPATGLPLWG
jgi:uncharacterized protein